jgi:hypothetical protein
MSIARLLSVCPNIQDRLDAIWSDKSAPLIAKPSLEFLMSPANRRQITQLATPGLSKRRKVEVRWFQRFEGDFVEGQEQPICVATEQYGDNTQEYEILATDSLGTGGEVIDIRDLDLYCGDNGAYLLERIRWHLEAIDRGVHIKTAQQLAASAGKYNVDVENVNGADELEFSVKLASGQYDPEAMQIISNAARENGYSSAPIVFGNKLHNYYMMSQSGCCIDLGVDFMSIVNQYGIGVAFDKEVSKALGNASKSIMMDVGAVQLLTYTSSQRLDGILPEILNRASNYAAFSLLSPAGLEVDFTVSDDCGKISVIPTATTRVITLPDDLFASGSDYEGVNYLNKLTIVDPPCNIPCYE